ncbi:O-antigen ligase family protein [Methyloglobulus sp.]|uniref:O-antigen ligase family protein n=1 Tax=Methyloglobulus sp. TaxID=2518622 RepID=UPI0032B878DD
MNNHLDQQILRNVDTVQHKAKLVQQRLLGYGTYVMGLFIISIYLSTALAIVVSVLIGLLWLLTAQFQKLPKVLKDSPVAIWALLLYLCFIVGLCYGDALSSEAYSMLRKYRELLFIPVLSCFFTDERYRTWAWKAFIIGSVLTLATSYLMDFGIMEMFRHKTFTLKSRITHSVFIAFFIFFCAHKIADSKQYLGGYALFLVFGIFNLFFIVQGRTGQVVFMALVLLFAVQRLSKKGLLLAMVMLVTLLALYINFSDKSARIYSGLTQTLAYLKHVPEKKPTDVSVRYAFWENSLKLVSEKPWLGHGTGSFAKEYQRVSGGNLDIKTSNPHNEFLLIAVQFGIFGFVIYFGFLFSQYYCSRELPDAEKWLAQGLLLTLIITSLFNSPLLDHAEGHWFSVMIALCFASNYSISKFERQDIST